MAATKTDANGNVIYLTDPSGNEILSNEKKFAGVILIIVTLLAALLIIAHWPDKMPPNKGSGTSTKYQYKWFAVTYLDSTGINTGDAEINVKTNSLFIKKKDSIIVATKVTTTEDRDTVGSVTDSGADAAKAAKAPVKPNTDKQTAKTSVCRKSCTRTIDLNILILLLVAIAGFLGNMIHIASSFTNFIGAGKFKRSWILWYCVKPFTAAALAVGVYIIFRAGFLNSAEATVSVNLYGVVAIAILAGLFTDMATQKLKEVFSVVFQSSTVRPNPLEYPPIKITSINPKTLPLNDETEIVLSGTGFDNRVLKFSIDGEEINDALVQPNSVVFKYKATKDKLQLIIYDEKGIELAKHDLIAAANTPPPAAVNDITPADLVVNTATKISITGTGMDTAVLVIKVNDAIIPGTDITKTATSITFNFTAAAAGNLAVVIEDDKGTVLFTKSITAN